MGMSKRALILLLCCVVAVGLVPRVPLIINTCSYFYHEDDAHHFNRTIEMAKRRDLNPYYFNKPSLHFYLRLPVVAASVAIAKARGELNSVNDIRTRDPYGLAGYAYSVSHPSILKWNRAFSAALSVGIITLSALIALQLGAGALGAIFAALITALSPEVLANSHIIGVDVVMALFCLLSTTFALKAAKSFSWRWFVLSGICAGLAGASKYNALPVALIPLSVWALKERSFKGFILCGALPLLGFLIGCPYAAITFTEFWAGLSYEVWHYGVAGHEGHTAQPGFEQALFYARWLISDGVGLGATLMAALGIAVLLASRTPQAMTLLVFPMAYTVLMVFQKANFTRNMVVIVPYVAIAAGYALTRLQTFLKSRGASRIVAALIIAATLAPLHHRALNVIKDATITDSRETLNNWVLHSRPSERDVAIAGPLQVPPSLFSSFGVDAFNPLRYSFASLVQAGYDYVVVPSELANEDKLQLFNRELVIEGEHEPQRVPKSPAITVLSLAQDAIDRAANAAPAQLDLLIDKDATILPCAGARETHCWLQNRRTLLNLHPEGVPHRSPIRFEAMSPWPSQQITISTLDHRELVAYTLAEPGKWEEFSVTLPPNTQKLLISISEVHSPSARFTGADKRRLGAAIRIPS